MTNWRRKAEFEVFLSKLDPNYIPNVKVPRRWWQFWKPPYEEVRGASQNQIRLAHGIPVIAEPPVPRSIGDDLFDLFGIR